MFWIKGSVQKQRCSHVEIEDQLAPQSLLAILNFYMRSSGRYQTLPLGSKSSILVWEVSILQLYIFIWNMKSKVLDSQQWWSSIIVINLCSCNGLLASEGPDSRVYGSEFELLNKWWWLSYNINVRHIWWMSHYIVDVHHWYMKQLIRDWMESKEKIRMKKSEQWH